MPDQEKQLTENMVDINTYLNDPELVSRLQRELNKMYATVHSTPGKGLRYKRSSIHYIVEHNFSPKDMMDEFQKTMNKTSNLPATVRNFITGTVIQCMYDIYDQNKSKEVNSNGEEESRS